MQSFMTKGRIIGIVGLILFAAGIVGWLGVINGSPDTIELTESAQWGLLVGMFFFFEALGSGFLIVGALKKSPTALLVGVAGIVGACVMILMDLYHPTAAWRLFLAPNIWSPMFLDLLVSALCIVFGVALIAAWKRGAEAPARVLRPAVVVVSVLFPLGTAWLCTTLPGQLGWSTLELVSFFLAVGVSAAAALCFLRMDGGRELLIAFLAATLVVTVAEAGFLVYGTDGRLELLTMHEVVTGKLAPLFWIMTIAFVLLPLALGFFKKVDVRIPAALGVAGIALSKYLFAIKGNLFPYLSLDNVSVQLLSTASGYPVTSYAPHFNEWLACAGAIGLVVAVVALLYPVVKGSELARR